jgi:hypothetical protein
MFPREGSLKKTISISDLLLSGLWRNIFYLVYVTTYNTYIQYHSRINPEGVEEAEKFLRDVHDLPKLISNGA